jgi:hypothetical protein
MLITLALGILFFGSCFLLWYRISEKIPHVVAIHDDVITQRLHESSARLRIFLLHFKTFYKEEYYHNIFWNFLGKVFYKLHIFLLKIDNALVGLLKKVRAHNGFGGLFIDEQATQPQPSSEKEKTDVQIEIPTENYWKVLKNEATLPVRKPRKRHSEGVRMRTARTSAVRKTSVKSEISGEQNSI